MEEPDTAKTSGSRRALEAIIDIVPSPRPGILSNRRGASAGSIEPSTRALPEAAAAARDLIVVALRDEVLGRVMSAFRVITYGATSVGAALGGRIAAATGIRTTFFFGAGLIAALLPYLILTTKRHNLQPDEAPR